MFQAPDAPIALRSAAAKRAPLDILAALVWIAAIVSIYGTIDGIHRFTGDTIGCDYLFFWGAGHAVNVDGPSAVYNDPELTGRLVQAVGKELGEQSLIEVDKIMGAEDFSEYRIGGTSLIKKGRALNWRRFLERL